ncbi:MAG TPA: hypothetical protein PKD09_00565 [Aggregatilinea sp.]|jgi:hypothetical protein|uniref:hypothetical protein n=1 Tax=Aggregatilinea sp. TaxID=2806333 RepID=UPI002BD43F36|nr:hypothetical protein [Aggregatilinea sp.]HML20108.1 hypothetical protein [Aggregatilinea sp.]
MIASDTLLASLELLNETLTATVVIFTVSILLYNLSRHSQSHVTRASSIVLLCVTLTYLGDVFVSLDPGQRYLDVWLRFQWIGISIVPAALFHLSDALLATTGRPSRGRRRLVVRISYIIGATFALLAIFTDVLITGPETAVMPRMVAESAFPVYMAYLVTIATVSMINVIRARRRCLTRYTRRRMTYLLSVFLSPIYGLFPFTVLFGELERASTTTLLIMLNLANLLILLMLVFMAYPLSFFGSERPDRVIKVQLLEFVLRGPVTGAAVLVMILFVPRVTNFLGVDGDSAMPFVAVTTLLFLQWSITLVLPVLQRWLIYTSDQQRAQWIQQLGDRLLTQADATQLLESILAALCDSLRVPTAFVARVQGGQAQLVQVVGSLLPSPEALTGSELSILIAQNGSSDNAIDGNLRRVDGVFVWHSYWLIPLRAAQMPSHDAEPELIGILGLWARAAAPDFLSDEWAMLEGLAHQSAQVLQDVQLQSEIFLVLEGLASQMDAMHQWRGISRYGHVAQIPTAAVGDLTSDPEFSDWVKDALRDYWGGPKLTDSELLGLNIVWHEMEELEDSNPVRALRAVLARAIENLKPEGQRSLTTTEWILYNILEMRFLQGRKVRDVALRLAMSESDLYRKQRIAIEEVAHQVVEMERRALERDGEPPETEQSR